MNNQTQKKVLITGGAGFIGSHVVRLFVKKYPHYKICNLDKLTYAGNLENLRDIESFPNYQFIKGDILDSELVNSIFNQHRFDSVIHLAAESHVDRSLDDPAAFAKTNILGTIQLLNAAKNLWKGKQDSKRFYHISTDEVYGSLEGPGLFTELTPTDPRSPYSASKAASDHFVRAYFTSFQLPVVISRCSNNYGPNHFPEKLIPLMINNIVNQQPLPVYGRGENIRDWLFVEDHAEAIDVIFHSGKNGETYNVGGNNEWKNIDVVMLLCRIVDKKLKRPEGTSEKLITFVQDRPGHDIRYAIDSSKLQRELDWKPKMNFEQGISATVDWYLSNSDWLSHVTSGAYLSYYDQMYKNR